MPRPAGSQAPRPPQSKTQPVLQGNCNASIRFRTAVSGGDGCGCTPPCSLCWTLSLFMLSPTPTGRLYHNAPQNPERCKRGRRRGPCALRRILRLRNFDLQQNVDSTANLPLRQLGASRSGCTHASHCPAGGRRTIVACGPGAPIKRRYACQRMFRWYPRTGVSFSALVLACSLDAARGNEARKHARTHANTRAHSSRALSFSPSLPLSTRAHSSRALSLRERIAHGLYPSLPLSLSPRWGCTHSNHIEDGSSYSPLVCG